MGMISGNQHRQARGKESGFYSVLRKGVGNYE